MAHAADSAELAAAVGAVRAASELCRSAQGRLLAGHTLTKGDAIAASVRFRGGATRSLSLPLAQPAWQLRRTSDGKQTE